MACQLAVHCRRTEDMGILSLQVFQTAVTTQRMQVSQPACPLPILVIVCLQCLIRAT